MVRARLRNSIEFRMNPRAVTTDVLLGIAPIALLIAVWQAIASFGYAPATLLPPPGVVLMRLAQQLTNSMFQHEIAATLFRLFAGFSIAVLLGDGGGYATPSNPVQGGAAGCRAIDPDWLPHRSGDFLHRGVSRRNDYLDRGSRPSPGDGGADLSGC